MPKRKAGGTEVTTATKLAAYEKWLKSRGVTWHKAVAHSEEGVVAGMGCAPHTSP